MASVRHSLIAGVAAVTVLVQNPAMAGVQHFGAEMVPQFVVAVMVPHFVVVVMVPYFVVTVAVPYFVVAATVPVRHFLMAEVIQERYLLIAGKVPLQNFLMAGKFIYFFLMIEPETSVNPRHWNIIYQIMVDSAREDLKN